MSMLFQSIDLRSLRLPNRIVVEPMTQFSADDGTAGRQSAMTIAPTGSQARGEPRGVHQSVPSARSSRIG